MKQPVDMWLQLGYFSQMSKTSVVRARVEPALKKDAEKVFAQLGLTTSEAIQLLFRQVALTRSLPFPLHLPNAETKKTLAASKRGLGVTHFKNKSDLYRYLGL
jgi:DNA-damage-inducible protein J